VVVDKGVVVSTPSALSDPYADKCVISAGPVKLEAKIDMLTENERKE